MDFSQLFQAFFEESSDALLAVKLENSAIVRANKTLCSLYGFNREDVEGERFNILHTSVPSGYERERTLSIQIMEHEGFYNDILIVTQSGETRYASVRVRHINVDEETYAIAVLSDDTERQLMMRDLVAKHQSMEQAYEELESVHLELKSTQDKMAQVSKLVALGELAAGMSHELNQPLTGVRGFAQELQDIIKNQKKPSRKHTLSLIHEIMHNADKMASLLSHLRDFARQEKQHFMHTKKEAVSVSESLQSVSSLLKTQMQKNEISLNVQLEDNSLSVLAQRHPFEQVLINLITNSRDSIIEKIEQNPNHVGLIDVEAWEKDDKTHITVTDNGGGIPEELKTRIFDPFFSTKSEGNGMGLGLSISFSIVHNFGGEISVERSDSSGSVFHLVFPSKAENPSKEAA